MVNWSEHDLNSYTARQLQAVPASKLKAVERECELHNDILSECQRRGWLPLHGKMNQKTGRTIGEPDFVILADGGRVLFIEAKARKEKPSKEQLALHAWARRLGQTVHVVRNIQEFIALCS